MRTESRIKDLCRTALFVVLTCVCTWIYIPFTLPFTMQTFAVFSALFCLGGKKGTISVAVYLFMGAAGLPVFSGFSGGIGVLFSSNGGFLIGFLLTGFVYTLLERLSKHVLTNAFLSMLICYITGTLWFFAVYSDSKDAQSILACLYICVIPFIIPDIIKILIAYYISKRMKKHLL